MRCRVNWSELSPAVKFLGASMGGGANAKVAPVRLEVNGEYLTISISGRAFLSSKIPATAIEPGVFTTTAAIFFDVACGMPRSEIEIFSESVGATERCTVTLDPGKNERPGPEYYFNRMGRLVVQSTPDISARLFENLTPVQSFDAPGEAKLCFELPSDVVSALLRPRVPHGECRVGGTILKMTPGGIESISISNHRMAIVSAMVSVPDGKEHDEIFVLPDFALPIIIKLLPKEGPCRLRFNQDGSCEISAENRSVIFRLLDAKLPGYQQVLNFATTGTHSATVSRSALHGALLRTGILAESTSRLSKLLIAPTSLRVEVQGYDDKAVEELEATSTGTGYVSINTQYLCEAVASLTGSSVTALFLNETKPIVLKSGDATDPWRIVWVIASLSPRT